MKLLHETGAECYSITFDGTAVNIAMCNSLGANYTLNEDFRPYFNNPSNSKQIQTIWDACHMVKLVRNALGDKGVLVSPQGRKIEWRFIVALHETQKNEGLHAATKLTARHINYKNEIMKVGLAVQTLSASVSKALLFCKELNLTHFDGCEATAEFCLIINNVFDILNSRNFFSRSEYGQALSNKNFDMYSKKILEYIDYLKQLTDTSGTLLINTRRKTGFLGLIVCLTCVQTLYRDLVITNYLKFILTYKLSQDHIETFFGAVRQRGGFNNNPSCLQFQTSYKRLLVKHKIKGSKNGNCAILDNLAILNVGCGAIPKPPNTLLEDIDSVIFSAQDHDYCASMFQLTPYVNDVVRYISGFVVKKVGPKVKCNVCQYHLFGQHSNSLLYDTKKRGKLLIASDSVETICLKLEGIIRQYQNVLYCKEKVTEFLTLKLFQNVSNVFDSETMNDHIYSQEVIDNHSFIN